MNISTLNVNPADILVYSTYYLVRPRGEDQVEVFNHIPTDAEVLDECESTAVVPAIMTFIRKGTFLWAFFYKLDGVGYVVGALPIPADTSDFELGRFMNRQEAIAYFEQKYDCKVAQPQPVKLVDKVLGWLRRAS